MQGRRSTCIERLYNRDSSYQGQPSYIMSRDKRNDVPVRASMCCGYCQDINRHVEDSSGRLIKERRNYDRSYKHRSNRRNHLESSSSSNGIHQKRNKPRQFNINAQLTGTGYFEESDDGFGPVMKTKVVQSESNKIRTQLIENRVKDEIIKTNNIEKNIKSERMSNENTEVNNKVIKKEPAEKIIDKKIPQDIPNWRKPIKEEKIINVPSPIKEEKKDRRKQSNESIYREIDEMLHIMCKKYSELKKNNSNDSSNNKPTIPKMSTDCSRNCFCGCKHQFSSVTARIRRRYMLSGSHFSNFNRRNDQTKAERCEEELNTQDLYDGKTDNLIRKWDKDIEDNKEPIRSNVLTGQQNFDTLKKEVSQKYLSDSNSSGSNASRGNEGSKLQLIKCKTENILPPASDNVQTLDNKCVLSEKIDVENTKSDFITPSGKESENVSQESSSLSSDPNSDSVSDQNDDKFSHHMFIATDLNQTKCGVTKTVDDPCEVELMRCLNYDKVTSTFVENSPIYSLQSKSVHVRNLKDGLSERCRETEPINEDVKMLNSFTLDPELLKSVVAGGKTDTSQNIDRENKTEPTIELNSKVILEPRGRLFKSETNINFQNTVENPELQKNDSSFTTHIQVTSLALSKHNAKQVDCKNMEKEMELLNGTSKIYSDTQNTNITQYCKYDFVDPTAKDNVICDGVEQMETTNDKGKIEFCCSASNVTTLSIRKERSNRTIAKNQMETANLMPEMYSGVSAEYCKCERDCGNVDKVTQFPIRVDKSVTVNEFLNNSLDIYSNLFEPRTEPLTEYDLNIRSQYFASCTDECCKNRNALVDGSVNYKKVRFVDIPKNVSKEEISPSLTVQNSKSSTVRGKKPLARCLQKIKNKFNRNK